VLIVQGVFKLKALFLVGDLKFDTDWNWLMPVAQKIMSSDCQLLAPSKGIQTSIYPYIKACRPFKRALMKADIDDVHAGVVEFIKWYNQQK